MNWADDSKELTHRRWWLKEHTPVCESCGSEDVLVLDLTSIPAVWWCRSCNVHFPYEPEET